MKLTPSPGYQVYSPDHPATVKSDEEKCMDYLDSRMAVIADKISRCDPSYHIGNYNASEEPPEKRVHPNDPTQTPHTWEGYLKFAQKKRFKHDSEALHFAQKMWKESFAHYSTDATEGQQ